MGLLTDVLALIVLISAPCHGRAATAKTVGAPWPMPQVYKPTPTVLLLSGSSFSFTIKGKSCDILSDALDRYYRTIFDGPALRDHDNTLRFRPHSQWPDQAAMFEMTVNVKTPCVNLYPDLDMDESYDLTVAAASGSLSGNTVWGVLRGLETFSQLIYQNEQGQFQTNATSVHDFPRFSWRGVLLDTSRHYLPKESIMQNLEAMAYNKMNVFHWHIVDNPSFPYQSRDFPGLSNKGAYQPYTHIYSQEDVADVIEFARKRGIRVVPEFDSPGHSLSWGKSQTSLLTKCYSGGEFDGSYGPIDPTLNTTYDFLKGFMKELTEVFPDKYLHLGGDEVSFACWKSNPLVKEFMKSHSFGSDYSKLEQFYMQNLLNIVESYKGNYVIWQEVVDNGVKVAPDTVVEVWKGQYAKELAKVTNLGFRSLLSSCWYLNRISSGADWRSLYRCDPHHFNGTEAQKKLVVGGEMCLWGEYIDSTNIISRGWPRGSAVAERLWSDSGMTDENEAEPRLEEHRCRLIRRGLPAEPVNGPGVCDFEYTPRL